MVVKKNIKSKNNKSNKNSTKKVAPKVKKKETKKDKIVRKPTKKTTPKAREVTKKKVKKVAPKVKKETKKPTKKVNSKIKKTGIKIKQKPIKEQVEKKDESTLKFSEKELKEIEKPKIEEVYAKKVSDVESNVLNDPIEELEQPISPVKKDSTPPFINVEDKNKRNNFGFSFSNKNAEKKINEINKRLNDKPKKWHISYKKKTINILLVFGIIAILFSVLFYSIPMLIENLPEKEVENGRCSVLMTAIHQGQEIEQPIELPDVTCRTVQDCKDELISRRFTQDLINQMKLSCVEAE